MKTAVCVFTGNVWVPVIALGEGTITGDQVTNEVAPQEAIATPAFAIGDSVEVNGRLYQGSAVVERLDGGDVLARAGNGKLYRYSKVDQDTGVITKISSDPAPKKTLTSDDFEEGDEVTANGNLYQGYGTVERIDGTDVLVRADNGKLYRYRPADLEAGLLSKS